MSDEARCNLCGEHVPPELLLGHLRGAHGMELEIAEWPDGRPVIIDETLEPDDFAEGVAAEGDA